MVIASVQVIFSSKSFVFCTPINWLELFPPNCEARPPPLEFCTRTTKIRRIAKNIIIVGDKLQLGSPVQGNHPNDSGKSILMGANGVDITLPSAALGLEFQIIQSADYSTAVCTIIQAAATEDFYGAVYGSTQGENAGTDADVGAASNTKITFSSASLKIFFTISKLL